jgi:uncharacterized protein (TIGR03067 family)
MWDSLLSAILFFVGAAAGMAAVAGDAAKKDLAAMQGVWKVVELAEKGAQLPDKELKPVQMVIDGPMMTLSDDGKFREEVILRLDPSQKLKAVDLVYTKGPNLGKLERGIYSIEGDVLKICVNETKDGARPTAFLSTKDNNWSVAVLKRVKK